MLKSIRLSLGLSRNELGELLGVSDESIKGYEMSNNPSSVVVTRYLENLSLPYEYENILRKVRKDNWRYDENQSPITNEVRRIKNGLGRTGRYLSNLLNKSKGYWDQEQHRGTPISDDVFDILSEEFIISSTTLRRHAIIVKCVENDLPIPETYKVDNPEIQEPVDLYDYQEQRICYEVYNKLLHELEDEFGSILNVPENNPKLIGLRKALGVIYYDDNSGI